MPTFSASHEGGASAEQPPTKVKPIDGKIVLTSNSQSPVDGSIRVSIGVLDRLMNLAGELVLGRNQLLQAVSQRDLKVIDAAATRLDQVTTEMQESIMQTRMQPIGNIFQKFTRIIRDLSNQLGKKVQLQIEGSDVELDKTIIEAIGDPLTHLIRNAVDHGIERPSVRQKAGKAEVGTVILKAFHQDGKVNIAIHDDGAGIDAEKVKRKAVEKGLISADEAKSLSERDAVRLIFHPGFSLADKVTEVSGRGVGMDVVRTNFEKLGGVIDIDTCVGQGSIFNIRLPLTLAIIPSLIVRSGDSDSPSHRSTFSNSSGSGQERLPTGSAASMTQRCFNFVARYYRWFDSPAPLASSRLSTTGGPANATPINGLHSPNADNKTNQNARRSSVILPIVAARPSRVH